MATSPKIGDRLSYDGALCTARYLGEVAGTSGSWIGVEWDDATRGKHDGSHKGTRYFTCKSRSPTAASFVRPTRRVDPPQSFLAALRDKYTGEVAAASAQIQFSGKVAEEVGFDKIRRKQANLGELKYAVLDGSRIAYPYAAAGEAEGEAEARIATTCPRVIELDLSRNLFTRLGTVVDICSELPALRHLRLNGNRFQDVLGDEGLGNADQVFRIIKDLGLEETLMSWEELCHVGTKFPALATLTADANQLLSLPATPLSTLSSTLVSLNLEFNEFSSLADLASLSELKALRNLHLKGNNIASISPADAPGAQPPVFPSTLQYLDISYNRVASWSFVDDLPACFPGLTHLRFTHNPIYDNPDPAFALTQASSSANKTASTEEAYMITVGRLGCLVALNFGTITVDDRQDAEMFYLARIGKHLAAVPESEEASVLAQHKRYAELVELHGAPVVNRKQEINPAFLEARLVALQLIFHPRDGGSVNEQVVQVPKSFDVYRVKGVAGELFGLEPLDLRLIWETGEWDPVAGFDDEVEDSSEEEDAGEMNPEEPVAQTEKRVGRWVKREVELQSGPRQLGFCVDGLDAKVRVELR